MYKKAFAVAMIALAANNAVAVDVVTGPLKKHNVLSCMACSSAMDALDWVVDNSFFEKVLIEISKVVCIWFKLSLTPVEICP